jgi:hypothetical protein
MVVKRLIEPELDQIFRPDSYGYRPGKSALDAVGITRQRCWKYDWVLELSNRNSLIKSLFWNFSGDVAGDRLVIERQEPLFRCTIGGPLPGTWLSSRSTPVAA